MYLTKESAAMMEYCIKQTHIEVTKEYANGAILDISGGAACFSGFESYLSQVVGWGFNTAPKNYLAEIQKIEGFYSTLNHSRIDIELCPYVGNDLAVFLSHRGYQVTELNNVSFLDLQTTTLQDCSLKGFKIKKIDSNDLDAWAHQVAEGFGYPEAKRQFKSYARAQGTSAFGVYDKDLLVAGGAIAMHGTVCDLGVTSTLPSHQGQGLQKKLINARLHYAKLNGMTLATVTTEPGSISDLNVQKIGFGCAYTRVKMTLMIP